ncbi:MAG: hypothetical protein FWG98_14055 [Candidatus Cloacimonetes bacterium]|nr:hypothetical protein [Candidatus Cloacimonadota bacterium]
MKKAFFMLFMTLFVFGILCANGLEDTFIISNQNVVWGGVYESTPPHLPSGGVEVKITIKNEYGIVIYSSEAITPPSVDNVPSSGVYNFGLPGIVQGNTYFVTVWLPKFSGKHIDVPYTGGVLRLDIIKGLAL